MTRICYIADANSVHTRRWIAPLVEQGCEVHLLSFRPVRQAFAGVTVVDLTRVFNTPKLRFAYWGWWIHRYLKRVDPDILHAHQLTGAGWLGVLARRHPFIVSAWGSDLLVEPQRSRFRRLLLQRVLRACDALTAPSRTTLDAAEALGVPARKLHLIPWGIETGVFRPEPADRAQTRAQLGLAATARIVLCTRALTPLYNLHVLLEAFAPVCRQLPDSRLVLLRYNADAGYADTLEKRAAALGLAEKVLWLPAQPSLEAMARLYRAADLTVSIPASEGYGFSVLEAMACGCPTLISDLPVFDPELAQGVHTIKVPVGDQQQTSAGLLDLLENQPLRERLSREGLAIVRGQGVEVRLQQVARLYAAATGDARATAGAAP